MKAIVIGTAITVVLAATLAIASGQPSNAVPATCLTSEDVLRHVERSRNGIPVSCDEERRRLNVRREALR